MVTRHLVIILLLATVACGDGNGGLTAPSPTVVITGLSITPAADLIKLRTRETFTATVTFSNGNSRPVPAVWGSDDPEIVAVDSSGLATGTGSGQTTIFADYEGHRATRLVRVVPDYHGLWQGDWRAAGCTEQGDWCGLCREFQTGMVWGLELDVAQNQEAITGTVDFGRSAGPVSGVIDLDGHMELSGAYTITIADQDIRISVTDWETITTDNEQMTGRFRATMQACWCQGSLSVDAQLRVVVKAAGTPVPSAVSRTEGLDRLVAQLRRQR